MYRRRINVNKSTEGDGKMENTTTPESSAVKTADAPVSSGSVSETAVPDKVTQHDEIARLAYTYWEKRGHQDGSPEEDWFRAERELNQRSAAASAG
jgi:hypothetical protein